MIMMVAMIIMMIMTVISMIMMTKKHNGTYRTTTDYLVKKRGRNPPDLVNDLPDLSELADSA